MSFLRFLACLSIPTVFAPRAAEAHVKWFSRYRYDHAPIPYAELNHAAFWGLLASTIVTIGLIVFADRKFEGWPRYQEWNRKLESFSGNASVILRVFTGASILLAWQVDAMIAPELKVPAPIVGWLEFFVSLALLLRVTTPIAGAGMIALYLYAMTQYGFFHLLDYLIYPAIGFYFLVDSVRSAKIRDSRIPALYVGLGFSLIWAALEKVFYPGWGLEALSLYPAITMGLDPKFFLLACAFIEMGLGFMLIVGLIERPLALTITLTFFTTTAFFGKTEVVGHTILHGALLVFIVVGVGRFYRPPIALHRSLGLRTAFACVNFLVVVGLLGAAYHALSQRTFENGGLPSPHTAEVLERDAGADGHEH